MLIWFLPLFIVMILIGVPIFFALLAAPFALLYADGQANFIPNLYRNLYTGMDSFPLMALPFFLLAGEIMNRGGITTRLVDFAQAMIGHLRGGLAHVNILSSFLFAGMSGSAVADVSALGRTLIPAMEREGYTRKFAAAITAASSIIGPIIPPSGIMIIYAYVMGESVAALFLAGIIPGILMGLGLMICVRVMADRYDLPKAQKSVRPNQEITTLEYWVSFFLLRLNFGGIVYWIAITFVGSDDPDVGQLTLKLSLFAVSVLAVHVLLMGYRRQVSHDFRLICKKAVAPLQTPIIILGGILIGVSTPTEASAVAVAYALLVAFFVLRSMRLADLWPVLSRAALGTSAVLLLVGAAVAFKTVVSLSHAPETMTEIILGLSDNPLVLLFLINMLLFLVGMFLDAGPAIIILGPILGPIFVELGVHPVHFAMIMAINLTVGLATPPMGLVLFVASGVSGEKVETIARAILPFLAVQVIVIFMITYIPAISLFIPRLTGFIN